MKKEFVLFVSAKPFLNCSDELFNKIFFCLHGRREVIVLSSNKLKEIVTNNIEVYSTYLFYS